MLKNPSETFDILSKNLANAVKEAGHEKVLIGLSGGADSALVAAIAVNALGKENVKCVFLPSDNSSPQSENLSNLFAVHVLSTEFQVYSVDLPHRAIQHSLMHGFSKDDIAGTVDENIQARVRGILLMGIANIEHRLVLATGNKSEALMGYCTMYGDTVGFCEVIGNLFKTECYQILEYLHTVNPSNTLRNIIDREPSAELSPNQKDTDTLPPYDVLDPILKVAEILLEWDRFSDSAPPVSVLQLWNIADHQVEEVSRISKASEGLVRSILKAVIHNRWKLLQCPPALSIR